jgi:hypothetical protein
MFKKKAPRATKPAAGAAGDAAAAGQAKETA